MEQWLTLAGLAWMAAGLDSGSPERGASGRTYIHRADTVTARTSTRAE